MKAASKPRLMLIKMGQLFRLLGVALMLLTAVAVVPSGASAKDLSAAASWGVQPLVQTDAEDEDEDRETPEDDEDEDRETPEDDQDEDRNTPEDDQDEDRNTPEDDESDFEMNPDWEDAGLISETEWESPQFGFAAEWVDPWVLDDYYEDDDDPDSFTVLSNEDDALDEVHIWIEDLGAILTIQGSDAVRSDAADVMDYWQTDEYFEGFTDGGEVLLAEGDNERAGVLFLIGDAEDGFIGYNEVTVVDDGETLIALYFRVPVADFPDSYEAGQDGVEVDGNEVFDVLSARDVEDAIEELE